MPLKKSHGNMYPWVSSMHTHLAGACPHSCSYCSTRSYAERYPAVRKRYSGDVRLVEAELKVRYGEGKAIFIEHMMDLFAEAVPSDFILRILLHCQEWPKNTYVFQSKNPGRMKKYLFAFDWMKRMAGTTIETNRAYPEMGRAPSPHQRYLDFKGIAPPTFITLEPLMDFDVEELSAWLLDLKPDFINIGADSKGHNLPEPPPEKVDALIRKLEGGGLEIREKHNLMRIFKGNSR